MRDQRVRCAMTISAIALSVLVACVDAPTHPSQQATSRRVSAQLSRTPYSHFVTYDDYMEQIAETEPTFAGMYFENGSLIVMSTDASRSATALRTAITEVLSDRRLSTAAIQVRPATYSWAQLYAWGKNLPGIFSVSGVTSTNIDQRTNRISIGIASDASRAPVLATLTNAGIPAVAITFHQRGVGRFTSSLADELRDILGGVRVAIDTSNDYCTIGFNTVDSNGTALFATNGHCSATFGASNDGTRFWQNTPVTAERIGVEGRESILFSSSDYSGCPSSGDYCKFSDLDLGVYNAGTISSQSVGFLYRPTSRTRFDSNLTVTSGANFAIEIRGKQLYAYLGDTVDKIGSRTGWTYGPVTATCATETVTNGVNNYYLLCSEEADLAQGPGDSGSSVFIYSGDSAIMVGQAYGAADSLVTGSNGSDFYHPVYFSSINNIQSEFGTLVMTIYRVVLTD